MDTPFQRLVRVFQSCESKPDVLELADIAANELGMAKAMVDQLGLSRIQKRKHHEMGTRIQDQLQPAKTVRSQRAHASPVTYFGVRIS